MEKQISITKIKIRHSQILLFLNCPKKPETLQGELRFQNAWLNFCHPVAFYPVGKSLVCPINTDKLENYDGDWKLTIQDSNDTYTPVFTSRVRLSLLFADCQNGWGRSEFLAASTESSNADQLMHGALRRDVCIFVRIWADTLYEVTISGL